MDLKKRSNEMEKTIKKKVIIAILFILLSVGSKTAICDYVIFPDMTMNATPNPVGSGARALGLGGAFISVVDDATAASWNPAGLLKLKNPEVSIVGSYFSGDMKYNTSLIEGNIYEITPGQKRLNYFSIVYPFFLLRRNMVVSLNYQHLYEFSKDNIYHWRYYVKDPESGHTIRDIPGMTSRKTQRGTLSTLSPAFAIQFVPSLYIGLAANLWLDDPFNNYWENLSIVEGEGKYTFGRIKVYAELYERYEFSDLNIFDFTCFNMNLGFLWKASRWFHLGGTIKTPFKAGIRHNFQQAFIAEYPDDPNSNDHGSETFIEDLTLEMPLSYGLGNSFRFYDSFLIALDIYRTHWEDFLIVYSSGEKISPINNEPQHKANIKTTTQIRLGVEYLVDYPRRIFPVRGGIFYDPEPAGGHIDHFYGISLGSGYSFGDFVFDIAYQYRFGKKENAEILQGHQISSNVKQHYLYASMIIYL